MKVIIFGTGKMYQKAKLKLRKDIEIVAFIDNNFSKWGSQIDGVPVFSPQEIAGFTYDFVFLLSAYHMKMREQLIGLGISNEKIYDVSQIEKICGCKPTKYFGSLAEYGDGKKILVFSHALTSTGAQNVLYIAMQALQKNGYHLAVVSKQDGVLKEHILSLGIPVIIMENPHSENIDFIETVKWADKIFVNTVWLHYIIEEALPFNKKVIWWIHETIGFNYLNEALFIRANKNDSLYIYAVSPLVKRKMIQNWGNNLDIKELVYGLPRYEAVKKKVCFREKAVFAIIGGIGWIKGQDIFIKAVEQLPQRHRANAEFWIVGGGQLGKEDLERARQYPCIKIIGEVDNAKMPDLYGQIDVVVCCSREDALPVVVTEGCMNGRLVIVSDVAGIADYITDGEDGLVFQSENVGQLAKMMEWVMEHGERARQMGRISKRLYQRYFTMEIFENNLLKAVQGQDIAYEDFNYHSMPEQ